jgi:hypothetical protein
MIMTAALIALTFLAVAGNYTRWFRVAPRIPDARTELRKLHERYAREAVHLQGTIRLYDKENDVLKEENTFELVKDKDQVYLRLSYLQTFIVNDLVVELDTVNRYVFVSRMEDAVSAGGSPLFLMDSLFSEKAPFKIAGSVSAIDARRSLRLTSDLHPEIRSFTITYDTATYRVHETEIEWWKAGTAPDEMQGNPVWQARVTYSHLPDPLLRVKDEIAGIITVAKREVRLAERYSDYQLYTRFE